MNVQISGLWMYSNQCNAQFYWIIMSEQYTFWAYINPLPVLMYQNVLDLNVACWAKRTGMYVNLNVHWKQTQPSCLCSRDLNWTSKGLRPSSRGTCTNRQLVLVSWVWCLLMGQDRADTILKR
jgi:hypothetical protein